MKIKSRNIAFALAAVAVLNGPARAQSTDSTADRSFNIIYSKAGIESAYRSGDSAVVVCDKKTGQTFTAFGLSRSWPSSSYSALPDAQKIGSIKDKDLVYLQYSSGLRPTKSEKFMGMCAPEVR